MIAFQTEAFASPKSKNGESNFFSNFLPGFDSDERLLQLQAQLRFDPSAIASIELKRKVSNLRESGQKLREENRVKIKADFESLFNPRMLYLFDDFMLIASEEYDPVTRGVILAFFHASHLSSLVFDTEGEEGLVLQDQLTQSLLYITFRTGPDRTRWVSVLETESAGRRSLLESENGKFRAVSTPNFFNSFDIFNKTPIQNGTSSHMNGIEQFGGESANSSLNIFNQAHQSSLSVSTAGYDEELDSLYSSPAGSTSSSRSSSRVNSLRGGSVPQNHNYNQSPNQNYTIHANPHSSSIVTSPKPNSQNVKSSDIFMGNGSTNSNRISVGSGRSLLSPPGSNSKKFDSPLVRTLDIPHAPETPVILLSKNLELRGHSRADHNFKVIVVGNSGVGKTSLISRFGTGQTNPAVSATVFPDSISKIYRLPGPDQPTIGFNIWDTAGQERFQSLMKAFYRGCTAAIVVYDVTDLNSFERLPFWLDELEVHGFDDFKILMLVGNKADLEGRRVSAPQAREFADQNGMMFHEVSASSGMNVDEAFFDLFNEVYGLVKGPTITSPPADINLRLSAEPSNESSCAC